MRIGLNGTPFDALSSGARDRFVNLNAELARRIDAELFVYSPREVSLEPLFPAPIAREVRSPLSSSHPLRRFLRSRRWFSEQARADRLDLFVTDHFPVLTAVPTLLTIHDLRFLVLSGEGSFLRRFYFRTRYAAVVRRAAAVVTVSRTVAGEVETRLGIPLDRIRVVPNGVPAGLGRAPEEAVRSLLRTRGLPSPYLLYVGVLEPRKNLRVLLRALARPEVRDLPPLVLAGRGGSEEGPLCALAGDLGIAGRVHFTGYVPQSQMSALLTGATALVLPSRYEGFGLPVLEAFAHGTPVVAARAGALPEVAGDAALLVSPDDAAEMAVAIRRATMDPSLRERLRLAGRARAQTCTWASAAERLETVIASIRPVTTPH